MAFPVGLSMIVRNEEANIGPCLRGIADLVAEIVIADTGSCDRTRELARGFQARLVDFPWCDDFAAARNATLSQITSPWVFWMDADDRLTEEGRGRLRAVFASLPEENVGYIMKCVSPREAGSGRASVSEHLRLFRNHPEIRWEGRVHEQIRHAVLRAGGRLCATDMADLPGARAAGRSGRSRPPAAVGAGNPSGRLDAAGSNASCQGRSIRGPGSRGKRTPDLSF